jgi:hypothetical protein
MSNNSAAIAAEQINERRRRPVRGVHCRKEKECEYEYRDERGKLVFTVARYKWRHAHTCDGTGACRGRTKTFSYWYWSPSGKKVERKPPYANSLLYRMEEVGPALVRGAGPIFWAEGEKDCDAIREGGGRATSHHGGAGKVTLAQAQCLYHQHRSYNAAWIILVADRDDAGAFDVCLRNNLLVQAGFKGRLDIVRAEVGKDAYDHLTAGYGLAQFVPVDKNRLRDAAGRYQADLESNTDNYMNGGE